MTERERTLLNIRILFSALEKAEAAFWRVFPEGTLSFWDEQRCADYFARLYDEIEAREMKL